MNPIDQPAARSILALRSVAALAVALAMGSVGLSAQAVEDEEVFYQLGVAVGRSLTEFQLSEEELAMVQKGLLDVVHAKPVAEPSETQMRRLGEIRNARVAAFTTSLLESVKQEDGAQVQSSGLVYFELQAGSGASPGTTDVVKVHYHGTLPNGSVFDSSVNRGQPAEFPLNRVIACWTEGVAMMKVGGKSKLVCPPGIAYGERGAPPSIPGGAVLTFEVELLEIVSAAETPSEE